MNKAWMLVAVLWLLPATGFAWLRPAPRARWSHPHLNMSFEPPVGWELHARTDMVAVLLQDIADDYKPWLRLDWRRQLPTGEEAEQDLREELEHAGDVVEELTRDRVTVAGWPTDRLRGTANSRGFRWQFGVLLIRVHAAPGAGYRVVAVHAETQAGRVRPVLQRTVDSMILGDNPGR